MIHTLTAQKSLPIAAPASKEKESEPDVSSVEMLRLFSAMDEQTKEIMLIQMRALVEANR